MVESLKINSVDKVCEAQLKRPISSKTKGEEREIMGTYFFKKQNEYGGAGINRYSLPLLELLKNNGLKVISPNTPRPLDEGNTLPAEEIMMKEVKNIENEDFMDANDQGPVLEEMVEVFKINQ